MIFGASKRPQTIEILVKIYLTRAHREIFYLYKIEGQLRELVYSYNGETKNHRVTSRFTLLLCTRRFGKLASYMVQWATINPAELQRIYYHRENVYR